VSPPANAMMTSPNSLNLGTLALRLAAMLVIPSSVNDSIASASILEAGLASVDCER